MENFAPPGKYSSYATGPNYPYLHDIEACWVLRALSFPFSDTLKMGTYMHGRVYMPNRILVKIKQTYFHTDQ